MDETSREITPTRTIVTMQSPEIELKLTFLTPAFPDDLALMARPVTYLAWDVKSRDGTTHNVAIYLDADGNTATNHPDEKVTWSRADILGLHLLRVGSSRQAMLQDWGDNVRINWGYFLYRNSRRRRSSMRGRKRELQERFRHNRKDSRGR